MKTYFTFLREKSEEIWPVQLLDFQFLEYLLDLLLVLMEFRGCLLNVNKLNVLDLILLEFQDEYFEYLELDIEDQYDDFFPENPTEKFELVLFQD